MALVEAIRQAVHQALKKLYQHDFSEKDFQINQTKSEFEGDYTVVLFSIVKLVKKAPDAIGNELGQELMRSFPELFSNFNLIKGFLNLDISDRYWLQFLHQHYAVTNYGLKPSGERRVMVEYSSPNTNKPLHLGHLRNNFLGWSVAEIYKANGNKIVKTCIVNDRGIHICKSMLAWQKFANGETPASTGMKGDHLVGLYYVKFNEQLKKETKPILDSIYDKGDLTLFTEAEKEKLNLHLSKITELEKTLQTSVSKLDHSSISKLGLEVSELKEERINWKNALKSVEEKVDEQNDVKENERKFRELQKMLKPVIAVQEKIEEHRDEIKDLAENKTGIMQETKKMLVDWEAGKPEVIELWKRMNQWVYDGFDVTYKRIGSDFQKVYYESETYLLGKIYVEEGLRKGIFYSKDDGSAWIDLSKEGLDQKLVLRSDGTSVYITQDIGLADVKEQEFKAEESIYVIGDEQNYHMQVLKIICEKFGIPNAEGIHHLSYGMVELPTGRMKSREGTVVDADDLLDEMYAIAERHTKELGKVKDFEPKELAELYNTISLGALKFFLMRVDPKKRMIFNPDESIDFHGFTGPFVQYSHARIKSVLRKKQPTGKIAEGSLLPLEKELVILLEQFRSVIEQAGTEMNPSVIAVYLFNLAKKFNSFYTEHSITNAESEDKMELRLQLAQLTAQVIRNGMRLLGIQVPERM
ncbi:MAG TPA: arginine--tRNA ligase [Chitinophagaceae bacterium]|nr:arginine--tRNA ligase [Chitinophagaceae bacterium]